MFANLIPKQADLIGMDTLKVTVYRVARVTSLEGRKLALVFFSFNFNVPVAIQDVGFALPEGLKAEAIVKQTFFGLDNGAAFSGEAFILEGTNSVMLRKGPGNPWQATGGVTNSWAEGLFVLEEAADGQ